MHSLNAPETIRRHNIKYSHKIREYFDACVYSRTYVFHISARPYCTRYFQQNKYWRSRRGNHLAGRVSLVRSDFHFTFIRASRSASRTRSAVSTRFRYENVREMYASYGSLCNYWLKATIQQEMNVRIQFFCTRNKILLAGTQRMGRFFRGGCPLRDCSSIENVFPVIGLRRG